MATTHSRLNGILFNKCPRCQEGNFFVTNSAFSRHFDRMNEACPHCGENLNPEPGFYWGSMFVSYAFYTAYIILSFWLVVQALGVDLDYYLIGLIPTLLLLTPWFFRMARRAWLTIFISPEPRKAPAPHSH
ncbi:hypothetical protein GCM10027578_25470 [Spirosoma luteolum]